MNSSFILINEAMAPIRKNMALLETLLSMISTADQDHGDQSPSFHINIHAGVELPDHEIAYTTLKGFAELTEDHNLCIYMNPELSENGFMLLSTQNVVPDCYDNSIFVDLSNQLCSFFNQEVQQLNDQAQKALKLLLQHKINGTAIRTFNPEQLQILQKIAALDSFMLDDQRDWFYFSEVAIDNAYKDMKKGLELLVLNEDIKDALKQLLDANNMEFCDLPILVVLYPLLVKSEENNKLVQACLSHLIGNNLINEPFIAGVQLEAGAFNSEMNTYTLLPHMKAVKELLIDIEADLTKV